VGGFGGSVGGGMWWLSRGDMVAQWERPLQTALDCKRSYPGFESGLPQSLLKGAKKLRLCVNKQISGWEASLLK
jgi:hypothetical protein